MNVEDQKERLEKAESKLEVGPVDMAALMGTPYQTYKKWRAGQRRMPAVAWRCVDLVIKTGGKL